MNREDDATFIRPFEYYVNKVKAGETYQSSGYYSTLPIKERRGYCDRETDSVQVVMHAYFQWHDLNIP